MKLRAFLSVAVSLLSFEAMANTEITIYNQDLALIKKSQTIAFQKGVNEIVFNEAAKQMQPESAFIFGDGVRVLEQNFDFSSVNYTNMLNANVGKTVNTVRQNPSTGENIFAKALLLATDGATPVLKFDYGIETNFPGRVLFDEVPLGLNNTPVLKARAEADVEGDKELFLAYLTSGFSWEANYVAKINDDKTLMLMGRVALNNSSGSDYNDVTVKLIAGDVNIVHNVMRPRMAKMVTMNAVMATDSFSASPVIEAPENLNGYYLYQIPQKTSLKDGQIKQVSFVNAAEVKYEKHGIINSTLSFRKYKNSFKDVHPSLAYEFVNEKDNGLGMPLPKGKISFYENDKDGALQFVGENTIANLAEGQKFTLKLGSFFDVYGEGEVTQIQKLNERKYKRKPSDQNVAVETTNLYDVVYKVTNKGKYTANIILRQPLSADAKIVQETTKGQYDSNDVYEWKFTIEPDKTVELKVSLQNKVVENDPGIIVLE